MKDNVLSTEQEQENELEMHEAFHKQVHAVLESEDRFRKAERTTRIGLEAEYSVINATCDQVDQTVRDQIIEDNRDFATQELGAAQIELRTDPIILSDGGIWQVFDQMASRDDAIRNAAHRRGARILRSGTNPLVDLHDILRTDKPKYRQVPDFHNRKRKFGTDTTIGNGKRVDVGDAAVVALLNSLQTNIEAVDFADATDKLNRSLMIGPYVTAVSSGARYIAHQDAGLADLRILAWETSHDTRTDSERTLGEKTRVGLPARYYTDVKDYFTQVGSYPFILHNPEAALQIGIGLHWRDTRLKVIGDSLVVEFRPISAQPTSAENVASALFYTGRLHWSQATNEPLLPFDKVEHNRKQALHEGPRGTMYYTEDNNVQRYKAPEIIKLELARAKHGLEMIGCHPKDIEPFFSVLEKNLDEGTPAERMHNVVSRLTENVSEKDKKEATHDALITAIQVLQFV